MDIGLIGFGGVGQALIKLLIDKESYLLQQYNLKIMEIRMLILI